MGDGPSGIPSVQTPEISKSEPVPPGQAGIYFTGSPADSCDGGLPLLLTEDMLTEAGFLCQPFHGRVY